MNEAETRAEHVAPALAAAGWGRVEGSRVRREYPLPARHEAPEVGEPEPDRQAPRHQVKVKLAEMQKLIEAEKSDLFDMLAHVAYALEPLTREERAARAKALIVGHFTDRQRAFLDFVLSHYVSEGMEELDPSKLTPLLKLKYRDSIADALADLGRPDEIGQVFSGFQRYLYAELA